MLHGCKALWSCPTLCNSVDCNPPGSSSSCLGFSRQEYWSGLSFSPPGDLPNPGIEPVSLMSPALAGSLPLVPPGMPMYTCPLFFGFPSHLGHTEHRAERILTGFLFSLVFCFTSGCSASGCCDRLWARISLGTSAGMVQMPLGFQFLSLPIRKAGSCPSSPVARLVLLGPPAASLGEPAG